MSKVFVQPSNLHGNGLFALVDIARRECIVSLEQPVYMSFQEAVEKLQPLDYIPENAFIFVLGDMGYLDETFLKRTPLWYYQNHSRKPNSQLRQKEGKIYFIALKKIKKGTEIVFNYNPGRKVAF